MQGNLDADASFKAVTLFSLEPELLQDGGFHKYKLLGKKTYRDPPTMQRILLAVKKSMRIPPKMGQAMCFNPRHGVRAIGKRGITDYVICFECNKLYLHRNKREQNHAISKVGEETLNTLLDEASIPRSGK